jgi:hypothetical protein
MVVAVVLAGAPAPAADGRERACATPLLAVSAPTEARAEAACALAEELSRALGSCGLPQSEPLTIVLLPGVVEPIPHMGCLGYYDCETAEIGVLDPVAEAVPPGQLGPYALLPPAEILRALLTHEMAHALALQAAAGRQLAPVDQEYIAMAMELELMEPSWREAMIAAAPVPLPPRAALIDLMIYGLAPRDFATNAWQHFHLPGNGCALIARIVAGEASFRAR